MTPEPANSERTESAGQLTRRLAAKRLEGKAAAYGEALDLLDSLATLGNGEVVDVLDLLDEAADVAAEIRATLEARRARAMHIRHKLEVEYARRGTSPARKTVTPKPSEEK